MSSIKLININNRTYYSFNDMINIKIFDPNQIKIDKKSEKISLFIALGILLSKALAMQKLNPLYFIIDKTDGYIEENNGNKYLTPCIY